MHALQPSGEVCEADVVQVGCEADLVVQVCARGGCREDLEGGGIQGESRDDVVADAGGSGGCQADDRGLGVCGPEMGEVGVCGAEIVAPFGDAMGLVDGDAGKLILGVDGVEVATEGLTLAVLGSHVEEAGARVATAEIFDDGVAVWERGVGVDGGDFDAGRAEGGDLVVHQGEEGRDDDGDAMVDHGG